MAACLFLGACQINAPRPAGINPLPRPPTALSSLTVPVTMKSSNLASEIDSRLSTAQGPGGIYWTSGEPLGGLPGDVTLQVGVDRSGPTTVSASGHQINYSIPLELNSGRVDFDEHVGFIRLRHAVTFGGGGNLAGSTALSIDDQWKLHSATTAAFNWTTPIRVDLNLPVGHLTIDVTSRVAPAVNGRLAAAAQMLDQKLDAIDVRSPLAKAWAAAAAPIKVSDSPHAWLVISPVSVSAGPPQAVGGDLVETPVITGRIALVSAAESPPPQAPGPLPDNTPAAGPPSPGVDVELRASATYEELNDQIRQKLVGSTHMFPGGQTITINAARIYGNGPSLVAWVAFTANTGIWPFRKVDGQVYFIGRPRYDVATHRLSVSNFDYDALTNSFLANKAAWLLHKPFEDKIQGALVLDLSKEVTPLETSIAPKLQGLAIAKGVSLSVQNPQIEVEADPYVGAAALDVLLKLTGQAVIDVAP